MSVFGRFVEIGRVAYIVKGPSRGKLCAIVDVIDQRRALVDGPCSGVRRRPLRFNNLHLTKFVCKFPHSARSNIVRKVWQKNEITKKWKESAWAKKLAAKKRRRSLGDFERFKLMRMRQLRNRIIHKEVCKLRKEIRNGGRKVSKKKAGTSKKTKKTAPAKKDEAPAKKDEAPAGKKTSPAKKAPTK